MASYIDVICKIEKKISEIEERLEKLEGRKERQYVSDVYFYEDHIKFYGLIDNLVYRYDSNYNYSIDSLLSNVKWYNRVHIGVFDGTPFTYQLLRILKILTDKGYKVEKDDVNNTIDLII